jgi:hypothetical protein
MVCFLSADKLALILARIEIPKPTRQTTRNVVTIKNGCQTIIGRAKILECLSEGWKVLLPNFKPIEFSCKFEV